MKLRALPMRGERQAVRHRRHRRRRAPTLSNGDEQDDARVHRAARDQRREPRRGRRQRRRRPTCARSISSTTLRRPPRLRRESANASASCATSGRRSATSCATRPARHASTTTTCCRSSSTASGSSSPARATSPNESMRYLRIPADDHDSIDGWVRLREGAVRPGDARAGGCALCGAGHACRQAARWRRSCRRPRCGRWRCSPAPKAPGATRKATQAARRPAGDLRLHRIQRAARPDRAAHLRSAAAHPERQPVRAAEPDPRERRASPR